MSAGPVLPHSAPTRALPAGAVVPGRWGGLDRYIVTAGALLAIALLFGFYSVVAGAMHRAAFSHEEARAALHRQVVCSAFSTASSRDLCLVTIASRASTAMLQASYRQSAKAGRTGQPSARLF